MGGFGFAVSGHRLIDGYRVVASAVAEGLQARAGGGADKAEAGQDGAAAEPLAEWEQELLAGATTSAPETAGDGAPTTS